MYNFDLTLSLAQAEIHERVRIRRFSSYRVCA